jgi:hypothetical protein
MSNFTTAELNKTYKYCIQDWTGKVLTAHGEFESFDDACTAVYEQVEADCHDAGYDRDTSTNYESYYEECLQEYYVVEVK